MRRCLALPAFLFALAGADRAAAIDCSPFWALGTSYLARDPEVARRLGPDLSGKLLKRADEDQWRMILAHSHILIEATPGRMVRIKNHDPNQDNRRVIEYRNVTWLRDLRRGASRPDTVLLGVTYFGEAGSGVRIEKDEEIAFDASRDSLPADPKRRYLLGLPMTREKELLAFANALTALPVADIGDPTSGCTSLFAMELVPPVEDHGGEWAPWGSRQQWETGMRMIDRLRDRPELH